LAEAAGSRYIQVRSAVAANSRTPAQTLAELAGDAEREVRKSVAENPNIPAATATRLADDEYWLVKYNLATVTQDPKVLRKLAKADKHLIRTAVARNAKTPANVREQLAQDEVPKVAQAAQSQG